MLFPQQLTNMNSNECFVPRFYKDAVAHKILNNKFVKITFRIPKL